MYSCLLLSSNILSNLDVTNACLLHIQLPISSMLITCFCITLFFITAVHFHLNKHKKRKKYDLNKYIPPILLTITTNVPFKCFDH